MDSFPKNLVDEYLKASNYLKKIERVVFKRFAPNVADVRNEYARLANKFEEAEIYSYAAMCHLGVAKCESVCGNTDNECNVYLKAARAFLAAHNQSVSLNLRCKRGEYVDGALRCYTLAIERCGDDSVLKAAIIREMTPLNPSYEVTSSFASPAHRIFELELAAHEAIEKKDFFTALQNLDDIVDNVYERKKQVLYEDLLKRIEIMRLLLLVVLNLPPSRQSPSHIKMIEHYYGMASFDLEEEGSERATGDPSSPGRHRLKDNFIPYQIKLSLSEIVYAWMENRFTDLKIVLISFKEQFKSLNSAQRFLIDCIYESINKEI